MKKLLPALFLAFVCCLPDAYAQQAPKAKLSPLTRQYLHKTESQPRQPEGYVYRTANGQVYISAIVKVNSTASEPAMNSLGAQVGTRAGNIWTVQIPANKVREFAQIPGIEYLQLDEPMAKSADFTRAQTRVDSVHAGTNLPMPYTGKDVVMGIIDVGFDYTHPAFFGINGTGYRVKKVWEQKALTGTPPAGFIFGNELTDSTAMWAHGTDIAPNSHGMHVAGIAAGSGYGSNPTHTRFRGMAYESDLVLVGITPEQVQHTSTSSADMIDGINYVFSYGTSVGKPAVANLSWGNGGIGPHDGTSLFSQACDNLTGPGKIFVCAASNNGNTNVHHQKTFTATDSLLNTFLAFNQYLPQKKQWVDIWGESGKSFCVQVGLWNGNTEVTNTGFICLTDSLHNLLLIGSNNDTCFVSISTSSAEYNGKPRIFMDFYSKVPDAVNIRVKGSNGMVNLWAGYVLGSMGYFGSFTNGGKPWATAGNTAQSLSDLATTQSAVTVGAYMSRKTYTDIGGTNWTYAGTQGAIASFSSRGPTADGRTKPDITAPGIAVGSAVSSFDPNFMPSGSSYVNVTNVFAQNGRNYPYAMLAGTSMASPVASGIVALMLQANPNLTPQDVKTILAQTALKDIYTTQNPNPNMWGAGKINGYRALLRVLNPTGLSQPKEELSFVLFPNPGSGRFSVGLERPQAETLMVEVRDVLGRSVSSEAWAVNQGYNSRQFTLPGATRGVYFIRVVSASGAALVNKLVVE